MEKIKHSKLELLKWLNSTQIFPRTSGYYRMGRNFLKSHSQILTVPSCSHPWWLNTAKTIKRQIESLEMILPLLANLDSWNSPTVLENLLNITYYLNSSWLLSYSWRKLLRFSYTPSLFTLSQCFIHISQKFFSYNSSKCHSFLASDVMNFHYYNRCKQNLTE